MGPQGQPFNPWGLKSYEDDTGRKHSFRFTRNGRPNTREASAREVHFSVKASAVYLYGAPKRHLDKPLIAQQEVCVGGTQCGKIEAERAYSNAEQGETVLIWSMEGLDPRITHFFILRLIEARGIDDRTMSLHRIEYEAEPVQKTVYPLPQGVTVLNKTIKDTDHAIEYLPRHCDYFGNCKTPWESRSFNVITWDRDGRNKKVVEETFALVKTAFAPWHSNDVPRAVFRFTGSAVCLYGAPISQIDQEIPHAAEEICLDGECEYFDLHQSYLNPRIAGFLEEQGGKKRPAISNQIDSQPEFGSIKSQLVGATSVRSPNVADRSVFLWSKEGLRYDEEHELIVRMIDRNPSGGGKISAITIDFMTYTTVEDLSSPSPSHSSLPSTVHPSPESSETVPIPQPSNIDTNPHPNPPSSSGPDSVYKTLFFIMLSIFMAAVGALGYWFYHMRRDHQDTFSSLFVPSQPQSPPPSGGHSERTQLLGPGSHPGYAPPLPYYGNALVPATDGRAIYYGSSNASNHETNRQLPVHSVIPQQPYHLPYIPGMHQQPYYVVFAPPHSGHAAFPGPSRPLSTGVVDEEEPMKPWESD
ncbi:uncharacterized protein EI90DRAFT_3030627 [Cantharellus anzutake]|uniref:uncharacterized protein n=1 Tax=Cantharellus anzutake TaxID=1750568 RepID=UPI001907DF18|nr:uncharacterized protein EI90DRAFT_3030627 [Cantharellus anzutake]KAF8342904.1 hypothetical protein EI90DRAFT_3030627 [Cantharellus anzutake]